MKVLLVANYALDRQHSMLGFARCLEHELPRRGLEPSTIQPRPRFGLLSQSKPLGKWLAYLDKYVVFPKVLQRASRQFDLVHILDQGNAMYVSSVAGKPQLVTCHDLLAVRAGLGELEGWTLGATGRKLQSLILRSLKCSQMIAAVSQATLDDVARLTGLPSRKLRLIYNGPYQPLTPLEDLESRQVLDCLGVCQPYLLHVGSDIPYKNVFGLLEIYDEIRLRSDGNCPGLVLVCPQLEAQTARRIAAVPSGRIVRLERASQNELAALYQRAEALVFPSKWEGFGLPIVEAQGLGCPVFTVNRRPMSEVGGSAAKYFELHDPASAAALILSSLANNEDVRVAGRQNAQRFSADRMAEEYAQLYREVVDGKVA